MSDVQIQEAKVVEATGHGRDHWYEILGSYGDVDHSDLARRLGHDHPELDGWWVQMLTVDYERAHGRREVGQSSDGGFQVSCSKTVAFGPTEAYERIVTTPFLTHADWQKGARWDAGDGQVEVRRADPGKMLRWSWSDDDGRSTVEVYFDGRPNKTVVTIRHKALPHAQAREAYRAKWKAALTTVFGPS